MEHQCIEFNREKKTLTSDPSLPIKDTFPDPLPPQPLPRRTELIIALQPPNYYHPLFLGQELRGVWEILDDPEAEHPCEDGG